MRYNACYHAFLFLSDSYSIPQQGSVLQTLSRQALLSYGKQPPSELNFAPTRPIIVRSCKGFLHCSLPYPYSYYSIASDIPSFKSRRRISFARSRKTPPLKLTSSADLIILHISSLHSATTRTTIEAANSKRLEET